MQKTILIIDDDPAILAVFTSALEQYGYRVVTAAGGEEGLEQARRHLPDLILSDINMPGTDGRTVLKTLRSDPDIGATQIVLMTGQPNDTSPRKGMELGADDFLLKPFGLGELKSCIEARLQRARVHWRIEDRLLSDLRGNLRHRLPHEFFTPLAAIIGLVDVLRGAWRELPPEEVEELLDDVGKSGWRLQRTLRNYLWMLELESMPGGEKKPESAPAGLSAGEAHSILADQAALIGRQRQRSEDIIVRPGTPAIGGIDAQSFELVVSELVDNACSFSAAGTPVDVAVDAEGTLRVSDQGRGMTEAQVRSLGAFSQIDRDKYEQQGLGLGLFLVGKIVAHCDASMEIHSRPGEGTTVELRFPPGAGA